jgi:hypothetical protein
LKEAAAKNEEEQYDFYDNFPLGGTFILDTFYSWILHAWHSFYGALPKEGWR